jgi:uncharacterized membrane protein
MKMIIKPLSLLILILLVSSSSFAQSSLNMYNNTDKDVYSAIATWDDENMCWTSRGWFKISPYTEKALPLGDYSGKVYIHGEQNTTWNTYTWGKGFSICVDPDNSFEIRNADKISCKKRASFSELNIRKGKNKWTFNP